MLQAFPFLRVLLGWLEGGTGTGQDPEPPPAPEESDKGGWIDPDG